MKKFYTNFSNFEKVQESKDETLNEGKASSMAATIIKTFDKPEDSEAFSDLLYEILSGTNSFSGLKLLAEDAYHMVHGIARGLTSEKETTPIAKDLMKVAEKLYKLF